MQNKAQANLDILLALGKLTGEEAEPRRLQSCCLDQALRECTGKRNGELTSAITALYNANLIEAYEDNHEYYVRLTAEGKNVYRTLIKLSK